MVRLLKLPGEGQAAPPPPASRHNFLDGDGADETSLLLRGHTGTVRDICYPSSYPTSSTSQGPGPSEGSERLLSVGAGDFACRVWDVRGGAPAAGGGRGQEGGIEPLVVFRGHTNTVFSCSMLPGGNVREGVCLICGVG